MTAEELEPLVYTLWPGRSSSTVDSSNWPHEFEIPIYPQWTNRTAVDDVFEFGEAYGRRAPIFPTVPPSNNTLLNYTGWYADSIYLLATAPDNSSMMCSLRAFLVADCSTLYQASMSRGVLTSNCEDANDEQLYSKSRPDAPNVTLQTDWASFATEWAKAINLNDGIDKMNAANARLLTQLMPKNASLNPLMPSIAEALAALAGSTLLVGAIHAPFVHDHYSQPPPTTLNYGEFKAVLQTHEYYSSYQQNWQLGYYIILLATFAINCYCLFYLVRKGNFLTDITEPQNLFSLAINSPPSQNLGGTYGSRLSKQQHSSTWSTKATDVNQVYFVRDEPSAREKDPGTTRSEQEGFIHGGQDYAAYTSVAQQSPEFV